MHPQIWELGLGERGTGYRYPQVGSEQWKKQFVFTKFIQTKNNRPQDFNDISNVHV